MRLSKTCGLSGAESLITDKFKSLLLNGDYQGAANYAADAGTSLRTESTVDSFLNLNITSGQAHPILY